MIFNKTILWNLYWEDKFFIRHDSNLDESYFSNEKYIFKDYLDNNDIEKII